MGKKHRPGGQGAESTFTEETPELSLEQNVHGRVILQLANIRACANLTSNNYNSATFSVSMST